MTAFDLFTIGHSNIAADRFVGLLHWAGVGAIADVRTTPVSRFCPWFSAKTLVPLLAGEGIDYLDFGQALGGRPRDPALYRDGVADYEAMAGQGEFKAALDRLIARAARRRGESGERGQICLMCAEREPLECHRCLLVARELAARGLHVGHVLHDGTIEAHAETERRLLELEGGDRDLFAPGQSERLAAAYRRRAQAVAYRAKGAAMGAAKIRRKR